MPIYEYQCDKCQQVTEAMQKFSDKPLTKCEHCGGKLQKLMSLSSFALKGTGWYTTDYKNKGAATPKATKSATSSPSGATANAEAKSATKTESKPKA